MWHETCNVSQTLLLKGFIVQHLTGVWNALTTLSLLVLISCVKWYELHMHIIREHGGVECNTNVFYRKDLKTQMHTRSFDWISGVHGNATTEIHLTSSLVAVWHGVCFFISRWRGQSNGDNAHWYGGESPWVKVSSKLCQQQQSSTLKSAR